MLKLCKEKKQKQRKDAHKHVEKNAHTKSKQQVWFVIKHAFCKKMNLATSWQNQSDQSFHCLHSDTLGP